MGEEDVLRLWRGVKDLYASIMVSLEEQLAARREDVIETSER